MARKAVSLALALLFLLALSPFGTAYARAVTPCGPGSVNISGIVNGVDPTAFPPGISLR